jgi:phosphoadenosine phosphosulfate reductase
LVGLSGGKDSLAVLDVLVRSQAFTRIECFAMWLVKGLELFERPVRAAAARYDLPVHFMPHWDLGRLLKHAVLRPHIWGADKLRQSKAKDVQRALTKRTGIDWFAYGERGADSYARWFFTHHKDGVRDEQGRLYPIWDWKTADVFAYLKARRIPVPERLGDRKVSGVDLQPASLAHIKARHPGDYRKILEVFPWAEVQVRKFESGEREQSVKEA